MAAGLLMIAYLAACVYYKWGGAPLRYVPYAPDPLLLPAPSPVIPPPSPCIPHAWEPTPTIPSPPIPTLPFILAPTILLLISALAYPLYKTNLQNQLAAEKEDDVYPSTATMEDRKEAVAATESGSMPDAIFDKEPTTSDYQVEGEVEEPKVVFICSENDVYPSTEDQGVTAPESGSLPDGNFDKEPTTNDHHVEGEFEEVEGEVEENDVYLSTEDQGVTAPESGSMPNDILDKESTTNHHHVEGEVEEVKGEVEVFLYALENDVYPSTATMEDQGVPESGSMPDDILDKEPTTNNHHVEGEVEEVEGEVDENDVYPSTATMDDQGVTAPEMPDGILDKEPTTNDHHVEDEVEEVKGEVEGEVEENDVYPSTATMEDQGVTAPEYGSMPDSILDKEPTTNDYHVEGEVEEVEGEVDDNDVYSSTEEQKEVRTPPETLPVSTDHRMKDEATTSHEKPKNAVDRAAAERDGKPQLTSLGTSQDDHDYSAFVSPDSNKLSSAELVDKIAEPFISQPEKKPLEQNAEPNPCEVTQSNSELHRPTGIPEATTTEIYNNDGTNESSSRLTLNCMEPVGDEPKSMIANSDWSATDSKENSEEPVKSVSAPSLDNSLPVEMATNSKQGTSDTKSDSGAQASLPAPPPRGMLLLRLKVKLPEGRITFLEFHDGDCIQTVAERWCRVWKVPNASTQAKTIVDAIYTRLDKYLG